MMEDTISKVGSLHAGFATDTGSVQSVRDITFRVGKGESLGIVGESGCGKSVAMLSIMGLLKGNVSRQVGAPFLNGEDLLKKSPKEMRKIQGNRIGMILQDPMTSLNPLPTVGRRVRGPLMHHQKLSRREAETEVLAMLEVVGLPSPERRLKQYPHELPDDMRQRAVTTITICCKSELLIANEPTAALDVAIQAQILEPMTHIRNESNTSAILITYDLGTISNLYTRATVMYGGLIMEGGNIENIFYRTGHPYTTGLLASIPKGTEEKLVPIFDTPPDLLNPPKEYPFMTRCSHAMKLCAVRRPPFCDLGNGHISTYWLHNEPVKAWVGEVKL